MSNKLYINYIYIYYNNKEKLFIYEKMSYILFI